MLTNARSFATTSAALLVVPLVLALTPTAARAQSIDGVAAGTRVRFALGPATRPRFGHGRAQNVAGTVTAMSRDTILLVVEPGGDAIRLPRSAIREAWVSGGFPNRLQAALRNAVVPALVSAAVSFAASSIHHQAGDPPPAQMALSSAAWGAASGAVVGAWSPKERWHRTQLDGDATTIVSR